MVNTSGVIGFGDLEAGGVLVVQPMRQECEGKSNQWEAEVLLRNTRARVMRL